MKITLDTSINELCDLGIIGIRANNVCRNAEIDTLRDLLNFPLAEFKSYRGCGKMTLREIEQVVLDYSCLLGSQQSKTYNIDLKMLKYANTIIDSVFDSDEILSDECFMRYKMANMRNIAPSLSDEEIEQAVYLEVKTGRIPLFYLLTKLLEKSDNIRMKCVCAFLGINKERKKYTVKEIATLLDRTPTTVSNKINRFYLYNKLYGQFIPEIIDYFDEIVWEGDEVLQKILEDNQLDFDNQTIMDLVSMTTGKFVVVDIDCLERKYLVSVDIESRFSIVEAAREFMWEYKIKRTEDKEVPLTQLMKYGHIRPRYSWSEPKKKVEPSEIRRIFEDLCSVYKYAELKEDSIVFKANDIDREAAMIEILSEIGQPTPAQMLLTSFNDKYPEYSLTDNQFNTITRKSERIIHRGLTGTLILDTWSFFPGTITEYIIKVLSDEDKLLSLDEVVDKVITEFPKTNWKSVQRLIALQTEKLDIYEKNYIGLKEKRYKNNRRKLKTIYPRK